jgi:hypothetical protein
MYNTTIFIEYQCSCPVRYYRNCKKPGQQNNPYCSIGIKDSKTGTITDGSGNYKLEIPDEAKIRKSHSLQPDIQTKVFLQMI